MTGFGVDPRVCGAAAGYTTLGGQFVGRSPRVRGSPRDHARAGRELGSIPACAGQPFPCPVSDSRARVDPRVCGAAGRIVELELRYVGRSPRVRGSRPARRYDDRGLGSIPACAGQPPCAACRARPHGVDPRVCGAAARACERPVVASGRSPRVRGSPSGLRHPLRGRGSIPACAGQPMARRPLLLLERVDPRVCGAASFPFLTQWSRLGRSPRVRGSLLTAGVLPGDTGSIPACAGQPRCRPRPARSRGVDPRVCGAAHRRLDLPK